MPMPDKAHDTRYENRLALRLHQRASDHRNHANALEKEIGKAATPVASTLRRRNARTRMVKDFELAAAIVEAAHQLQPTLEREPLLSPVVRALLDALAAVDAR